MDADDGGGDSADGADDERDESVDREAVDGEAVDRETVDDKGVDGEEKPCPSCGESLPVAARFCPYCATPIDEDGEAVDLSQLDGGGMPEDPTSLLSEDGQGNRRASGRIRALSGLAVSIPIAPLVLFIVWSLVPLTLWTGAFVFVTGWVVAGAILARSRVPAEAFGRSLTLIAVCTAAVPLAMSIGGLESFGGAEAIGFEAVAAVALVVAAAAFALGRYVTQQSRKRVSGERRAFEELREE